MAKTDDTVRLLERLVQIEEYRANIEREFIQHRTGLSIEKLPQAKPEKPSKTDGQ